MSCLCCVRPRGDEEKASTSAPEKGKFKSAGRVQPVLANGLSVDSKVDSNGKLSSNNGQPPSSRGTGLFPKSRVHPDPANPARASVQNSSAGAAPPPEAALKKKRSGRAPKSSGNGSTRQWWEDQCTQGQVTDRYALGRTIGKGAYSTVTEGIHKSTGERFAIKVIKLKGDTKEDLAKQRDKILSEVYLTYNLRHKNLLHLEEFYVEPKKIVMVLELMRGGSLFDDVLERGGYSEGDARKIFKQILSALDYMHNTDVIHRDIKLENLLLEWPNDLESVKIADLGFAVQLRGGPASRRTMAGTPAYLAPEMIMCMQRQLTLDQVLTGALDMWAAGVALYLLLGGYPPFEGTTSKELFTAILRNEPEFDAPLWSRVSEEAQDLICSLLVKNPSNRITAGEALEHPWFATKIEGATPSAKSSAASEVGDQNPEAFEGLKRYISFSRVDGQGNRKDSAQQDQKPSRPMSVSHRDRTSSFIKPSYFLDLQNRHRDSWGSGLDRSLRRIFSHNRQRPMMPSRSKKQLSASTGLYEGATRSSHFEPEEFGLDGEPTQLERDMKGAYQANKERATKPTQGTSSVAHPLPAVSSFTRVLPSGPSQPTGAPMPRSAFNEVEISGSSATPLPGQGLPAVPAVQENSKPEKPLVESHRSWLQQSISRRSMVVHSPDVEEGKEEDDKAQLASAVPIKGPHTKSMHMSQHFGNDRSEDEDEDDEESMDPRAANGKGPDLSEPSMTGVEPDRKAPSRAPSMFMGSMALHTLAPEECVGGKEDEEIVRDLTSPGRGEEARGPSSFKHAASLQDRRTSAPLNLDEKASSSSGATGEVMSKFSKRAMMTKPHPRSTKSVRWGEASVREVEPQTPQTPLVENSATDVQSVQSEPAPAHLANESEDEDLRPRKMSEPDHLKGQGVPLTPLTEAAPEVTGVGQAGPALEQLDRDVYGSVEHTMLPLTPPQPPVPGFVHQGSGNHRNFSPPKRTSDHDAALPAWMSPAPPLTGQEQ